MPVTERFGGVSENTERDNPEEHVEDKADETLESIGKTSSLRLFFQTYVPVIGQLFCCKLNKTERIMSRCRS